MLLAGVSTAASCHHSSPQNKPAVSLPRQLETEKQQVLKIAEAIAYKQYGSVINDELPLTATRSGDSVWIVEGTLPAGDDGGTVYIVLTKGDHRILTLTHYK